MGSEVFNEGAGGPACSEDSDLFHKGRLSLQGTVILH
jgi:hypothetical protein